MFELQTITYHTSTKKVLLHDLNLVIEPGQMTAIMGLNGSGKTTLLKVLSHILKPTIGSVFYDTKNLQRFSTKELARHIAFVPQDFPTDFPFTVFEFVMMGRFPWQKSLFNQAADNKIVQAVLHDLELQDFANRSIAHLSGGEKQRVLMARALAQQTPVILLDEPLNHLDIKNKIGILKILKKQNRKNQKTIIAVMHDLHDVKANFDHVIFLKNGTLAFQGDIASAFRHDLIQDVFEIDSW